MPCDIDSEHVEVMVENEIHIFACDNRCTSVDCSEYNWNYVLFSCLHTRTILLDLEECVELNALINFKCKLINIFLCVVTCNAV
jgi:hypothetical protein